LRRNVKVMVMKKMNGRERRRRRKKGEE